MAKKDQELQKPVVTSLPLPASDAVLVIDLPDGQKLLVGKMPTGAVIEVATWRGTGRPDSRTNRLMLGMSDSESSATADQNETESSTVVRGLNLGYLIYLLKNLAILLNNIFVKTVEFTKRKKLNTFKSKNSTKSKSSTTDPDLALWLEQVTQRSQAALKESLPTENRSAPAKKTVKKANTKKSTAAKRTQKGTK